MYLQDVTWPEVDGYLSSRDGVVIPIGSVEQHGPSGVMGTDAMVPEKIAMEVGKESGVLIGPVVSIGIAEHHMSFPGTLSLRPSTLIALVTDYVNSLVYHGFRRFFFLNGHGGNVATLRAAISEMHMQQRLNPSSCSIQFDMVNWYDLDEVAELRKQFYGKREGRHATPSEIAVIQYLRADLIKDGPLIPPASYQGEVHGADDFKQKYFDGRIGSHAEMATPEQGRILFDTAVKGCIDKIGKFFD